MGLDRPTLVADRARDLDRLPADPLRLDEVAEEHQRLGERREHPGPEVGDVAGHDRRGAAMFRQGPVVVTDGPRGAPEHLVDRRGDLRVLPLPEAARGRLEIGQRPVRPAGGKGHLGGLEQQPPVGGAGAARRTQLESELACPEGVRRGVEPFGDLGRREGRGASPRRLVGGEPMRQRRWSIGSERGGEREVMAPPLDRQQVVLDGLGDELVAELQALVLALDEEATVDRLDDAGSEVRVEDTVAATRPGGRPRRQAVDKALEGRRDCRELAAIQRPARRGQEPKDAAALRGATGEAGVDELVERRAEGQAR